MDRTSHNYSLVTTRTPDKITPKIRVACSQLAPGIMPIFVDRAPAPEALVNKCSHNVKNYLLSNQGEILFGWEVCVWDRVLVRFIGHAIAKTPDGLRCVTPSKYGETKLLFLPDSELRFDFSDPNARMPSKQIPISSRQEVKRLIEVDAAEHAVKIKYPVSSGDISVTGQDAIDLTNLGREKNTLTLRLILDTNDHTTKCPCGSGKKFRKCHQGAIEMSLRHNTR